MVQYHQLIAKYPLLLGKDFSVEIFYFPEIPDVDQRHIVWSFGAIFSHKIWCLISICFDKNSYDTYVIADWRNVI